MAESYSQFKESLRQELEPFLGTLDQLTNHKLFYGKDDELKTYIRTGESTNVINNFDAYLGQSLNSDKTSSLQTLKAQLKSIINKTEIDSKNKNFKSNLFNSSAFDEAFSSSTTEGADNKKKVLNALTTPNINNKFIIERIASAIFVRRLAFLYAYATVAEKLATLIAPVPVNPEPGKPNPNNIIPGTLVDINDINATDCKELLLTASKEVQNLREIIRNLLLFHNEDVNLGMHSELIPNQMGPAPPTDT